MRIINVNTGEKRMSSPSISYNHLLRDIKSCSILNNEEINICLDGVKNNDTKSIDKLVKSYLCFILSMAKLMNTKLLSVGDLVNEGCIGLIKAAKKFDIQKSKGNKFLSYAVWYIQAYMMASINKFDDFIRLPDPMCELRKKAHKTSNMFLVKNSYLPTNAEISEIMEVSESSIDLVLSVHENRRIISTDDNCFTYTINETMETFGINPLETYVSNDNSPDSNMIKESLLIDLERSIGTLTKREGQVLKLYFGVLLDDDSEIKQSLTLEEIGCIFDLETERVRQTMEKAIRRLKQTSRSDILRKYLGQL